jgi:hypothetical protein
VAAAAGAEAEDAAAAVGDEEARVMRSHMVALRDMLSRRLGALLLALLLSTPVGARAAGQPVPQQDFASPQDATDALIGALQRDDRTAFAALMGPEGSRLLASGDPIADDNARKGFLAAYAEKHSLTVQPDDHAVLVAGANDWPLPIPIVQTNGRWHFDTHAGAQEIINRRIGRNEVGTIRTLLAIDDAEAEYKTATGAYAARLLSSAGAQDGLYWPAEPGAPESPLGPLVDQAIDEGYPGAVEAGKQIPYHGYFFRVLKSQGPSADGGRMSYLVGGRQTGGFAVLAWPASYGSSGIMTFQMNQDGVVFQKDLGPDSAKRAAATGTFDPDLSWARVDITP